MAELSPADVPQLYMNTVVLYKGIPVHVVDVDRMNLHIKDLATGKKHTKAHSFEDFKSPSRLGMMNVDGGCVYIVRVSKRLYTIGINSDNISFEALKGAAYPKGEWAALDGAHHDNKAMANTILGIYPSCEEAIAKAKADQGTCAFDRQFAVDYTGNVFYKTNIVGSIEGDKILFSKGKEYLSLVLGTNYEKGFGCFPLS